MYPPQYPVPPPGFSQHYDYYRTPPVSPQVHGYYSPRYSAHAATPSPRASPKVSSRRNSQSQDQPPRYQYASPRAPYHFEGYSSPRYTTSQQSTPRRDTDYVSYSDYLRSSSRRFRDPERERAQQHHPQGDSKRRASRAGKQSMYTVVVDDDFDYHHYYDAPPPYQAYESSYDNYYAAYRGTDPYYYDQVPIYTEAEPTPQRSRARRASHSDRPQTTPKKPVPKPTPTKTESRKATDDDARRAGIPAGYSTKNWDPTEEPILLLGSVFDANSLGKWIYDWTVFHYGPATPMSEVAGELWLLLIQLAGKVKRADEGMSKIRKTESREMVEDFLESGERLWIRFAKLLKLCEDYMWKAARKESGEKKPVSMGKNSGCEFVDSMFGRDRELEKTEKLMTGMRLWSMRFDANCEDILRYPSA